MERLKNESYQDYRIRRKRVQAQRKRKSTVIWLGHKGTYTIKNYGPIKNRINQPLKKSKSFFK